ncbi:UDP-N-acetylglucosamine transferase subunit ALG13 [Granulicatella balaenopterae]|uniref:UDP-N-acetylglucosamine transferase subunit ALG13 n=1 Tax=Granulicatella balaenopterae TaxID=137733 RepID=A0A1H9K8Y0_9LACT|nr:glycosyltransferase [Granulicatella balaenopterae]SEQ95518.1 UDP-N-acetylglucosamine transferase subunit ALG13 [Granulicatella balaenopterae]
MIFVTVGTHEQQFNRLIECVDTLKANGIITEEIIIQTGYSTYEPKHCVWSKLFPYTEMIKNIEKARIVITHGGPSSFIMPLQVGKIPIVVPRKKVFDEHVNDHQLEFAKAVEERQGNIIVIDNVKELKDIVINYDSIIQTMPSAMNSNNQLFNRKFEDIINNIF